MFHLIAWIQSEYYYHQYLRSIPKDVRDDNHEGPFSMNGKEYTIHIYGREGHKPRFHILDKDNNDICSISLLKPKYIGKPSRYLNKQELKDLDSYLRIVNKAKYKKDSYWEVLSLCWGMMDFNSDKYKIGKQPDYTLLEKEN